MFVVSLVLIGFTAFPAYCAENEVGAGDEFDAHTPYARLHFTDNEMDFSFALILGATVNDGAEIGECFTVAGKIKEGDAASWQKEWADMAAKVAARGEKALAEGHDFSAMRQFLRACYYYRASLISMLPENPQMKINAKKGRDLLIRAGKLMKPQLEYIEIPFGDTRLPGFFRKAADDGKKHKTLVMIGGGETFAEDLVFYIQKIAHERGYNFLTVDLPGQGLMPYQGAVFMADVEKPLMKVMDYVVSRPEVDTDKVAMFGISGGGEFGPKTAQYDKRIRVVVANSGVYDAHALFADMPIAQATADVVDKWSAFKQGTVKAIAWRWGVKGDNIPALVDANKGFEFDPAKVTCPFLSIVGEGEYESKEVQRQQKVIMDNLGSKVKKLIVTPADEGASNHCLTENRSLMSQEVFDFIDEQFEDVKTK